MRLLKCEKGLAMPLALMVLIVITLLGTALWYYSMSELDQSVREEKKARAYYLARAGAESLARDLIINPEKIEKLIPDPGNVESLGDYGTEINFETDYSGEVGRIDAELERIDEDSIRITGTGIVDGINEISESVSILLEMHGLFDGVLYAEADLDFDSTTNVTGDIYTAGVIKCDGNVIEENHSCDNITGDIYYGQSFNFKSVSFPPNDEYPDYPGYPLADDYIYEDDNFHQNTIFRISTEELDNVENPSGNAIDGTLLAYEEIYIRNKGSLIIDASNNPVHVRAETFNMHSGGELEIVTAAGNKLRIFTNDIILTDVIVTGDGVAEIFVYGENSKINIQTKKASVVDPGANLIFYLDDGCEMFIQAHGSLEGLIYGPGAYVTMQGGTFEGSMIAHEVTGQGVRIRTHLEHEESYSWDIADIDLGYVMVHWLR